MRIKILYIITIFVTSGIWSCGSSKKVQKQSEVVRIEANTKSNDSTSVVRNFLTTETDSINEELQITITEYDTSKPIDKTTGKPPVKKEVKASKSKHSKKDSEQKIAEQEVSIIAEESHTQIQDSIASEITKEKSETTIPKQMSGLVWALCAFVSLIIVLYIAKFLKK